MPGVGITSGTTSELEKDVADVILSIEVDGVLLDVANRAVNVSV